MLKPLHARWVRILQRDVIGKRKKIIESGWRAAGITDAICLVSNDPFHDIGRQIGYLGVEADDEGDESDREFNNRNTF